MPSQGGPLFGHSSGGRFESSARRQPRSISLRGHRSPPFLFPADSPERRALRQAADGARIPRKACPERRAVKLRALAQSQSQTARRLWNDTDRGFLSPDGRPGDARGAHRKGSRERERRGLFPLPDADRQPAHNRLPSGSGGTHGTDAERAQAGPGGGGRESLHQRSLDRRR